MTLAQGVVAGWCSDLREMVGFNTSLLDTSVPGIGSGAGGGLFSVAINPWSYLFVSIRKTYAHPDGIPCGFGCMYIGGLPHTVLSSSIIVISVLLFDYSLAFERWNQAAVGTVVKVCLLSFSLSQITAKLVSNFPGKWLHFAIAYPSWCDIREIISQVGFLPSPWVVRISV
jgi:hypothetical protein